jgi:hypothetical protein
MKKLIIEKSGYKSMIQIEVKNKQAKVKSTRFIEVKHKESMSFNSEFAQHEHIRIGNTFISCSALNKHILICVESYLQEKVGEEQKALIESTSLIKESHSLFH